MAIYNYGIGGNEVKVDANESIAEIPSNRTLIVQKLTDEAPAAPESVYGLETIEDVFQRFEPTVDLRHVDAEGNEIKEILKSATKLFSVLLASKRPLITELADKLRLTYPLLPTISPFPTMRLEAIRSIIRISCRRYPKSV